MFLCHWESAGPLPLGLCRLRGARSPSERPGEVAAGWGSSQLSKGRKMTLTLRSVRVTGLPWGSGRPPPQLPHERGGPFPAAGPPPPGPRPVAHVLDKPVKLAP